MKTPKEWVEQIYRNWLVAGGQKWTVLNEEAVEAIQRDALSDPMAQTDDLQEASIQKEFREKIQQENRRLEHNVEFYKQKWHEARKYLRAANKGAERNAIALDLATKRWWSELKSDKRFEERKQFEHQTIVWNWLTMSDEDLTKKLGEHATSQELRLCRLILKAMLGTSILKL